jgi:hypothetical protein
MTLTDETILEMTNRVYDQLRLPCMMTLQEAKLEAERRWGCRGYAKVNQGECEVGIEAPAWWVVLGRGPNFETAFEVATEHIGDTQ